MWRGSGARGGGTTSNRMQRIGVAFQARVEFGPNPTAGTTEADADFVVDVVFANPSATSSLAKPPVVVVPSHLTSPNGKPRISVESSSVNPENINLSIFRFALGIENSPSTLGAEIDSVELEEFARMVENAIGGRPNSYTIDNL